MRYKGASNLKGAEIPKEKLSKLSSGSTRFRKKFNIQFSKYRTVSNSNIETDSEDNVKELLTIVYPKEQFSNKHIKHLGSMCYKEASDTEVDKSLKEKMNKLFSQSTHSRKKCEREVTVRKSKRKSNSEESVEEILTMFFPKKRFSKRHLKHPISFSYKETSNSEGDESPKEKLMKFSSRGVSSYKKCEAQFSKFVTVSKSESETDSENDVREIQTKTFQNKQFSTRRTRHPTAMSYKEASNSESNDSPEENMTKLFPPNTRSRVKCEVKFSKYITVGKSKRETNSEDRVVEEIIKIISPNKQFSNQHLKRPTPISYKEAEGAESFGGKIIEFSSRSTRSRKKDKPNFFEDVTVSKYKSETHSEDSVEKIPTIISPKKHIKFPLPMSYKEASNSEGDESPKEKITKFSLQSTDSCNSKYVTVSESKSETDSENNIKEMQTKIARKKRFSKRHIKFPSPISYKEASSSESDESPKEKITKFSLRSTDSCNSKYVTVSESKSETDSENNVKEMHTKITKNKCFSKRRMKCLAPLSYKEASSSECDESSIKKISTLSSRKLSNFENLAKFKRRTYVKDDLCSSKSCNEVSNMISQSGITLASEVDVQDGLFEKRNAEFVKCAKTGKRKLIVSSSMSKGEEVLVKANKKLTCKVVEKVNANSQPIVEKKVTCTNSSKGPTTRSFKEVLECIDNKGAMEKWNAQQCTIMLTPKNKKDNFVIRHRKKVTLKEDYVPETRSNKCRVRQCSVPPTPINVKSDNNKMNICVEDQVILSKDHSFETQGNPDKTDEKDKSINCCISESHSLKLSPCNIVLSPNPLEKCDLHTNCSKSSNVFKSKKGLESTTKVAQCEVSRNTVTEMLDTNELPVKGVVVDTFLQPCCVTLNKLPSFPEGCEIDKFKTVTFESEHVFEKQTKVDLLHPLNKSNKTSALTSKNEGFAEGVNSNSSSETFNYIPHSVRRARRKNYNSSKSNLISLDTFEDSKEIALNTPNKKTSYNAVNKKADKYNSVLKSKFRFRKKQISQNSGDLFVSVKKVSSKNPKRNVLKSRNTYESCVNGDNTNLQYLKNAEDNTFDNDSTESKSFQIDYTNDNAEEDLFCNSEDQLTSEKKDMEIPKRHTLFPDNESILNGVSENTSSAGSKSNVKHETSEPAMISGSQGNVSSKALSMGACGMQSNNVELKSETGIGKQPRYFHSKKVSRSLKDSIKRRKLTRANTSIGEWNIQKRHSNPDVRRRSPRLPRHNENSKKAGTSLSRKKVHSCFMCVQCNQSVSSRRALYEHLCSGKRKEGYLCYICEKIFKLRSQLMKHERFHLSHRIDLDKDLLP